MKKIIDYIVKNRLNFLLIILWFLIAIIGLTHHELWRDETQVWCVVRDLDLTSIFNAVRIEGHPLLWYLILTPFAKLNFPVESMQIISLLFVFSAVIYFTLKSPFSNTFKFLFIFSCGMIYDLSIIPRNYCLIPLFTFLLADFYSKRFKHPYIYSILIILLSQTHSLMLGLSGILALIFIIENFLKKKNFVPNFLLISNFLSLFFYFLGSISKNVAIAGYKEQPFIDFLREFSLLHFAYLDVIPKSFGYFLYLILAILFYFTFKHDKKIFLICVIGVSFILGVLGKIWCGGVLYQKAFIIFFPIILTYWILKKKYNIKNKILEIAIYTLCIFSFIKAPISLMQEILFNFSGSKQITEFIKKELNDEKEFIFVGHSFYISPISAYLKDKKIYSYNNQTYITFYLFDGEFEKMPLPDEVKYYIIQEDYYPVENSGFKKIFSTQPHTISRQTQREVYSIYLKENK